MQVGSTNSAPASSAAPASSPILPEPVGSRAEQFARVLKSAFFGANTKAVSQSAERSVPEAARRQDTRPAAEPARNAASNTNYRDASASAPASRESSDRQAATRRPSAQPADWAAKPREAAPKADKAAGEDTAATSETDTAVNEDAAAQPADTLPKSDAVAQPAQPATVVETAPDASVILALLQGEAPEMPVVDGDAAAASVSVEEGAALPATLPAMAEKAAAAVAQTPVSPMPAAPAEAAEPALIPLAEMAPVEPQAMVEMRKAAAAPATSTSAAALLVEQDAVSAEDFAAIQQTLLTQQQKSGQPVAENAAKPQAIAGDGKTGSLQVQTVTAAASSKTLVDQSALLAMQGDEMAEEPSSLQTQLAPQPQADGKFAAALQANSDAVLPQSQAATQSPAHLSQQAASPLANPGTSAPQAAQHATAMQVAARQLSQHIPAGEQVAVQIKRGVADGHDKISIRLDPGNLGKVEVKMEVGHDGRLMAVVAADKPDTLAMLQKDAAQLEQALRDAGLKADSNSLSFTLRDQNQAGERGSRDGQMAGHGGDAGQDEYADGSLRVDPAQLAAANAQRAAAARGGLDIRI
jgi:flagellar hook-length control protein FliK